MVQFRIKSVRMTSRSPDFLTVEVTFQRIFNYHLGATFAPTILLLLIAETTLLIEEHHFEATIMVSLTTMLVMYTLIQSNSVSLPNTAYLKMIDVWLMNGLAVPFFVFLYHVVNELIKSKRERQQQDIKSHGHEPLDEHSDGKQYDDGKERRIKLHEASVIMTSNPEMEQQIKKRGAWLDSPIWSNSELTEGRIELASKNKCSTLNFKALVRFGIPLSTFLFLSYYGIRAYMLYYDH